MESSNVELCGVASWKPKWLQRFATPVTFLVSACMVAFADAFFFGILGGIVTSLETRYKLSAKRLGFLFTMDGIGLVAFTLLVSYFGGHPSRNRPRWIAWGNVINTIGIAMFILPQFIYKPYNYQTLGNGDVINEPFVQLCHNLSSASRHNCLDSDSGDNVAEADEAAYILLTIGVLLMGIGYSPVRSLSFSFIDDNAPKKSGLFFGE